MIAVALKGLLGRKLRAALTALAIMLGVAMVSGTYVLTDTISSAFRTAIAEAQAGTSAVISGKEIVDFSRSGHPTLPAALLERVLALPEVEAATGTVSDSAKLVDREGRLIQSSLGWTFAFSYDPRGERFNPTALVAGRWPAGPREIVIDKGTAGRKGFAVGHEIGVLLRGPVREFRIVGLARFGSISIGGVSFAIFDTATAQALFGKRGRFDEISLAARPGVSPQELVRKIAPILPASARVRTAQAEVDEDRKEIEEGLGFVRKFLLAFGGIALFVGAFVIFNTLSITVAQRAREFATLRMIGASRRQVLASVGLEALVIGTLGSVAGLVLGLGLAKGLNALFVSFGIDLPRSGTVFATRTVVVSLLVGVVVTLLAGLAPAIRATRVPPVAAVREGATLPRSRLSGLAPGIGLATTALGIAALLYGMFASGVEATQRLLAFGLGSLTLFVGVALVSPRLVVPFASLLGLPARRLGGAAGRLARENSMRNPSRTAVTAAALMIGLALVTLVGVLGAGVRESVGRTIERQLRADYVVTSQSGFEPFAVAAGEAVARAPGVELAADVRGEDALVDGSEKEATGIDPGPLDQVYDFAWKEGSNAVLDELGPNEAIVTEDLADTHGLGIGSRITIHSPSGGRAEFVVQGVYRPPLIGSLLGDVSIPLGTFDRLFPRAQNLYTFVNVGGEEYPTAAETLKRALADFPDATVQTRDEFVTRTQDQLTQALGLLYVLLTLSVIVSLFGMVNTLVLSVFERTRELGMLRAVGMTRRQVRRMVRHESVITALIGAALGIPLGILLATLVSRALADEGMVFALPAGMLATFAAVAVIAGVLAAILPARRASRLNVLEALQYE